MTSSTEPAQSAESLGGGTARLEAGPAQSRGGGCITTTTRRAAPSARAASYRDWAALRACSARPRGCAESPASWLHGPGFPGGPGGGACGCTRGRRRGSVVWIAAGNGRLRLSESGFFPRKIWTGIRRWARPGEELILQSTSAFPPLAIIKTVKDLSGTGRWKPAHRSTEEEVNLKMKNTVK